MKTLMNSFRQVEKYEDVSDAVTMIGLIGNHYQRDLAKGP